MDLFPFVLKRAARHWQLLVTLGLGVVLTTALLSSGPLLVDAVVETGLHLALRSSRASDANLRLAAVTTCDHDRYRSTDGRTQRLLRATLGDHLDLVVRSGETQWMFPWPGGQPATDRRVNLRFYEGTRDRVEYVAGRWPEEPGDNPAVVRAVIGDGMARDYALRVGDQLPLSLRQDSADPTVWIEVAAVVRPRDPRDAFWFGEYGPLTSRSTERWSSQHNVVVPAEAFFPAVSALTPDEPLELAWYVLLRHDSFSGPGIGPFQSQLAELESELAVLAPPVTITTGVVDILKRFEIQLESIRVPIYVLIAELMLLALFYVTMAAALLMREVEREFVILRSRGASARQIVGIQSVEAVIILAVGFLSGPCLGAGLVKVLSWVGPLADVGEIGWGLRFGQSAWLATAAGTLACLAGLFLPLSSALRRSIVTYGRMASRSRRPPWWQRLYLDVFVLVGGLVLLWRLRLYGEMTAAGPGAARLDWLLLLSPVAMLLGGATILLRVFPAALRALALLAARGSQLSGPLALWQVSRNPTHVTRLVLLLTLAVALANLSTGLNVTLDQSEYDRARYQAGNDLRLVSQQAVPLVDLQSAPGVRHLSGSWRGEGTVDLAWTDGSADTDSARFEVLAIEPQSFAQVTTFRDDFSEYDVDELLDHLVIPEGEHPSLLSLPGTPATFGLWLWGMRENKTELDSHRRLIAGDSDAERVGVVAKLQMAQGEVFTVRLQRQETATEAALKTEGFTLHTTIGGRDVGLRLSIKPDNRGWNYFESSVPVLPPTSYPLSLHSLWFRCEATRLGEPVVKDMAVVLDDLTVVDATTDKPEVVEDFEDLTRTLFLNVMDGSSIWHGLFTSPTTIAARSGESGQSVFLAYTRLHQTYGLRLRQIWTAVPLPAIASPAFMDATQLQRGDVVRASVGRTHQSEGRTEIGRDEVDFRIVGTMRYFPTMYEQLRAGFLITSRDLLLALLNDTSEVATNPNEVLIDSDGSASIDRLSPMVPVLLQSWQAEGVRQTLKANPLALGLRSVTFFGSALTLLLSLVGFATHFYLTVRQREMLHGVLRALGMSARQLYASIVLEQAVLILAGLMLGTGLGLLLNQVTLPRLPVSLADRPPIPPFVPRTDWLSIGLLYLFLVAAFLIILAIVTALLWRARIHQVLRIGQE